jgi:hypothetical protein
VPEGLVGVNEKFSRMTLYFQCTDSHALFKDPLCDWYVEVMARPSGANRRETESRVAGVSH